MIIVDVLVCLILLAAAVGVIFVPKLPSAAILAGAVSLMVSFLFLRMNAPDVAMTEAAIGAGLSTVIFLIAIRRTEEDEA